MKKIISLAAALCIGVSGFSQVPYLQDFEGTNPPSGWVLTNTDGFGWTFGNTAAVSSSYFAPPDHTTFAIMNDDNAGSSAPIANDTMKTAVINGIPANAWLTFDYYFFGYETQTAGVYEDFNVNVSMDGGASWIQLADVPGITSDAWATVQYDLSAYAGQNIMLAFVYNGGDTWMYGAALDNVSIAVPPSNSMQYTSIFPAAGSPNSYVVGGNNISISGVVTNLGVNPITTYTVKYTDGTSTWSDVKTDNITTYNASTFTISTPYNVAMGPHNIKSWIELTGDASHTDDTLTTVLTGATFLPTHQMVVEEGTGCWCGWCVRGIVFMDSIKLTHPSDISLIAVHDKTGGTDPMAVTSYNNGLVSLPGFQGFPSIVVDRKEIYDPAQIFDAFDAHGADFGFADLTLNASITGTTLTATTSVKPAIDMNGSYQLALVLTEDSVHSTSTTYQQHNYYSGGSYGELRDGTTGLDFDVLPSYVPAASMYYDHVARSITSSFTGVPSSLPSAMTAGSTYNYTFNSVTTSSWVQTRLMAVLLLIDVNQGIILNSKSVHPTIITSGIAKKESNINNVNVFPNPASNNFNVNVDLAKSQKTTVSLTNVMGQVVYTKDFEFNMGSNLINISADQLASGMYTLSVTSETGVHQTKITVAK